MGAFIRTEDWSSFQVNDETIITCFLPPDFSGQDEFIALQGKATIRRLDPVNKCVAVELVKSFDNLSGALTSQRAWGIGH